MDFKHFFESIPDRSYEDITGVTGKNYFTSEEHWAHTPERCFVFLKDYVPPYIENVLDLGTGNGRNLLPFDNKEIFATDMTCGENIRWATGLRTVSYKSMSVEDLTQAIQESEVDLSKTLIIASAVLMYVPKVWQEDFYNASIMRGCRNFIFQEYPNHDPIHQDYFFKLPQSEFIVKRFRDHQGIYQPLTFIHLDIPQNSLAMILQANTNLSFSRVRGPYATGLWYSRRWYWKLAGVLVRIRDRAMWK